MSTSNAVRLLWVGWRFHLANLMRSGFFVLIFPSCSVGSSVSYSAFGKKSLLAGA